MNENKSKIEYIQSLLKDCQASAEVEFANNKTGEKLLKCDFYDIEDAAIFEGEEINITCIGIDFKVYCGKVYKANDLDETIILKRDEVIGMLQFKYSDFLGFFIDTLDNSKQ